MNFYQVVQRLLLVGVRIDRGPSPPEPVPPPELAALIAVVAPAHRRFDARAVRYGNSYRSGFWAIYLISAVAVLCGVLPLALGWDSRFPEQHPFARFWTYIEVGLILTVIAIYLRGHRAKWRSEWLAARTTAELTWYLPLLAPLVDLDQAGRDANWYNRIFNSDKRTVTATEVEALCAELEPLARQLHAGPWQEPTFVARYLVWAVQVFEGQKAYHHRLGIRQHALLHRVHRINNLLFGMTAIGASMHLFLHSLWLTLVTTFFPSLAASLHGALAQSEAFRLARTSEKMAEDLHVAIRRINELTARADRTQALAEVRGFIGETLAILLQEHQAWHMLVRPHDLPLA
jgi:hypothetical protein